MAGLWDWFKGRRRPDGKLVAGDVAGKPAAGKPVAGGDPHAAIASRETGTRSTEASADKSTDDRKKNGDRPRRTVRARAKS
jgi:hypothetical protein